VLNLRDSSRGYAAVEIIIFSVLPILVFSLVPVGFQAIQKQLAAESVVRMVARELMIAKPESPETEASRLATEIAREFDYPASLAVECIRGCDEGGGWYRLKLQIDSATATKIAVIEK
jgi:hypothetical protein